MRPTMCAKCSRNIVSGYGLLNSYTIEGNFTQLSLVFGCYLQQEFVIVIDHLNNASYWSMCKWLNH